MFPNKIQKLINCYILCIGFAFSGLTIGLAQDAADPLDDQSVAVDSIKSKKIILDALELKDMDINDVLKLIASKSGLNIIAGKNVQGRVTIYLKNVEVHDALTIILKANDLAYIEDQGVVQIVTEADFQKIYGYKFGRNTERKVVNLKSMKAADAVALLNQVKSSEGKIVADDQSNTLMIEDTADRITYLMSYLKDVDLPTQWQVFELKHIPVEGVAAKITEQISSKIGSIKFDASSNKLFVKDTPSKLKDLVKFIGEIDIPRVTKVFEISYAKAEDIVKMITPLLTKDLGTIQADARFNKVIVTDIAPKIAEMQAVITSVDKKEHEVLINARIVQIILDDSYNMGINWDTIVKKSNGLNFANNFSLPGNVSNPPMSTTKIGTLNSGDYGAVLSLIATMGNTKILSNPHIAVVNNQEAKILIGTNQPYATSTTTTPSSGAATTAEAVNFIDVGVKLHVTPTIHDDGYITMKIHPEVSSVSGTYTTTSNGSSTSVPIVETSEVDTTVRVKDGVTIIIGGLIKDEISKIKNKVPVLGDIPLMGRMFQNDQRSINKTETVIFLTPHIISGDAHTDPEKYPMIGIKQNKSYYSPIHEER